MKKDYLQKIAESTMEIIKLGKYKNSAGGIVSIKPLVDTAISKSVLYKPNDTSIESTNYQINTSPTIEVTRESTLEAAARLANGRVCVLNFASAKHPGGGFLRGSPAQEESIARSSALYHTLIVHPEFYEENKRSQRNNIGLYLDYAIYSPDVPVIKTDSGNYLDELYLMSVVTSPAPNRNVILNPPDGLDDQDLIYPPNSNDIDKIEKTIEAVLNTRIHKILAIMAKHGHRTIVLGAWGCGVFGNDPLLVAELFKENLKNQPYFDTIVFPIYDRSESEQFRSFVQIFG